jgi:N-methylhydantoinase A
VRDLAPLITTDNLVGAFPVKTPQLDIRSVGAGGGSIAWVDVDGALQVGPQSAGADPGPASYGQGGREATVTDANLVLGRIAATRPLGGSLRLEPGLAEAALREVARRLPGLEVPRLAEGIVRIAVARMTASIREITIQRGHDPRDFTLCAFGGAGPMHAIPVAEELGITRILVPRHPGNFSALGLLASDVRLDAVRTRIQRLGEETVPDIRATLAAMRAEGALRLAADGFGPEATRFEAALDLRYAGQAFELIVPVDPDGLTAARVVADFHRRHEELYGHADEAGEVEVVNLRLASYGLVPRPEWPPYRSATAVLAEAQTGERRVYFAGGFAPCPVYERERLPAGVTLPGPAIVEELGATAVLFPGWRAAVDPWGHLRVDRGR